MKTALHKCRDCESTVVTAKAILCPNCKAAAEERSKDKRRERAREHYRTAQAIARAAKPADANSSRNCATPGCINKREGKAAYCPSCHYTQQQKSYRENVKSLQADLPSEPPTSLKWLDKFSGWAGSGMSYAEYQKMGSDKRSRT